MSVPRLHVAQPLTQGATLRIEGERAHYLRNVLRLREEAVVHPFNGDDGEWLGRVVACDRHRLDLFLERLLRPPVLERGPTLVFTPIRRNRLDWVVEKAVELGAARLVPVLTRRTVARPDRADRLEAIAIEAAEQCERLTVPEIATPVALTQWLRSRPSQPVLHADERGEGMPIGLAARRFGAAEILIGPEGGFAEDELALLRNEPLVIPVSLGQLILRAETAAIYALVAWQLAQVDA